MRTRARGTSAWSGRLTPAERKLAPELLRQIEARGPLASDEFGPTVRSRRIAWGTATQVKSTLQKLFFHGELLIAGRVNQRRRYDLPSRVLPAAVLRQPAAPAEETRHWLALLKLRQRRLALLKRDEAAVLGNAVVALAIPGCPPAFALATDGALIDQCEVDASSAANRAGPLQLLAPLDPVIYDRRLTAALWNFEYTWEAYTPAAKRVRGHYALPVRAGLELVGHVEPKADRAARRLRVASRSVRRGIKTAEAVRELAAWLGLRAPSGG